jgi:hypothetical protein
MILRAFLIWLLLVVLAIVNGTVRTFWLVPHLGDQTGHIISCVSLSCLVFLAAWLFIGWIHPSSSGEAMGLGAFWLAMTVMFEFGAGHFLFGNSWEKLLADYNVLRGRLWFVVLIVTFLAPVWASRLRGLTASDAR